MKVLFSEEQLQQGIKRMADEINQRFSSEPLTVICVMTGSIILVADLIRRLEMPVKLGSVHASSYYGETSRSELKVDTSMLPDLMDSNVLIVDDIFDTGHTLSAVHQHIKPLGAANIGTAVLLYKHGRQELDFQVDFIGFEIPDQFVVGYGLDYQGIYRNLPYIGVIESQDLAENQ
ncbi:MAG: hypoxanthine phosphoribosyltransferase [Planctomycetaceae bacterium]|nr:hypoxanthine phosphoribosyltransferase [Planctomycetaceae bacterium]